MQTTKHNMYGAKMFKGKLLQNNPTLLEPLIYLVPSVLRPSTIYDENPPKGSCKAHVPLCT